MISNSFNVSNQFIYIMVTEDIIMDDSVEKEKHADAELAEQNQRLMVQFTSETGKIYSLKRLVHSYNRRLSVVAVVLTPI